jgi:hypothetical protein
MSAGLGTRLASPGVLAAAAALLTFGIVAPLSRAPGVSGEEAAFLGPLLLSVHPESQDASPPLAPRVVRAALAAAAPLGQDPVAASRLPSALSAALLAALVSLLAGELAGPLAAALAPALLFAAPRLLAPFLHAGPRPLGTALVFAAAVAYWRSARSRTAMGRVRNGGAAGVLFGVAVVAALEAALLLPVLAAHAALVAVLRHLRPSPRERPGEPPAPIEASLRGVPVAVAALAVVGPAVALALWPWLWPDPLRRLAEAVRLLPGDAIPWHLGRPLGGPRLPWTYPVVTTALALPAALVLAGVVGVLHALLRLLRALRGAPGLSDELFLLLGVVSPFVAAQLGLVVRGPGLAPWLPAFPFLAVLSARAVVSAARAAWPGRARGLAGVAGGLAVAACAVATAHAWPEPGAAWGELAGGAPGAASLGLQRQDGEAVAALLRSVAARARPGARVHLAASRTDALALYQASGLLRADLVPVATPEEADLALVPLDGGARAREYRIWAAFDTATPVDGVFLDEVPLAWVYARPGAWR